MRDGGDWWEADLFAIVNHGGERFVRSGSPATEKLGRADNAWANKAFIIFPSYGNVSPLG